LFYIDGDIKRYLKELIQKIKYFNKIFCLLLVHNDTWLQLKIAKTVIDDKKYSDSLTRHMTVNLKFINKTCCLLKPFLEFNQQNSFFFMKLGIVFIDKQLIITLLTFEVIKLFSRHV
jgi:hypothetical protein